MKPIEFDEQTGVIAKDQPQYIPIPARVMPWGEAIFCWELSDEEIELLKTTKRIWHKVLTFNRPLQPQMLSVEKPEMPVEKTTCIKCGVWLPENEFVCEDCKTATPN